MTAPQVFLTETRERFLKAVLTELPADRIRELYLFAPIRQGGVESGVAVVAAWPVTAGEANGVPGAESHSASETEQVPGGESHPASETEPVPGASETEQVPGAESHPEPETEQVPGAECHSAAREDPEQYRERYTVFTARYRHTLKGPDRGKWDASVVAEADAPLLSIETVVRGVQRRAGDVDPPDHMSGDELRAALRLTPAGSDA